MKKIISIVVIVLLAFPLFGCSLIALSLLSPSDSTDEPPVQIEEWVEEETQPEPSASTSDADLAERLKKIPTPEQKQQPMEDSTERQQLPGGTKKEEDEQLPKKSQETKETASSISYDEIDPDGWLIGTPVPDEDQLPKKYGFEKKDFFPTLDFTLDEEDGYYIKDLANPFFSKGMARASFHYILEDFESLVYTYELNPSVSAEDMKEDVQQPLDLLAEELGRDYWVLDWTGAENILNGLDEDEYLLDPSPSDQLTVDMVDDGLQDWHNDQSGIIFCVFDEPASDELDVMVTLIFDSGLDDLMPFDFFADSADEEISSGEDNSHIYIQLTALEENPAHIFMDLYDTADPPSSPTVQPTSYDFNALDTDQPYPRATVADLLHDPDVEQGHDDDTGQDVYTKDMDIQDYEGYMEAVAEKDEILSIHYVIDTAPHYAPLEAADMFDLLGDSAEEFLGDIQNTTWVDGEKKPLHLSDIKQTILNRQSATFESQWETEDYTVRVTLLTLGDSCIARMSYYFD